MRQIDWQRSIETEHSTYSVITKTLRPKNTVVQATLTLSYANLATMREVFHLLAANRSATGLRNGAQYLSGYHNDTKTEEYGLGDSGTFLGKHRYHARRLYFC
jgi:hypothetical protein